MNPRKHPLQPVAWDGRGTIRFVANPIVRFLLDNSGIDLNRLTALGVTHRWTQADWSQFHQITGYSVDGWESLACASEGQVKLVQARVSELLEAQPKDPLLTVRDDFMRAERTSVVHYLRAQNTPAGAKMADEIEAGLHELDSELEEREAVSIASERLNGARADEVESEPIASGVIAAPVRQRSEIPPAPFAVDFSDLGTRRSEIPPALYPKGFETAVNGHRR